MPSALLGAQSEHPHACGPGTRCDLPVVRDQGQASEVIRQAQPMEVGEQVDVIGHHLDAVQRHAAFGRDLAQQFIEPLVHQGADSTGRRYFEHQTTWNLRLNTAPAFLV